MQEVATQAAERWLPPKRQPTRAWLYENYVLPAEAGDGAGPYNPDYVPSLWGLMHAMDDDAVEMIVAMKAAQIGWTFLLVGWLLSVIHMDPSVILALFPKDDKSREFVDEKLEPAVAATTVVQDLIDVSGSRKAGNRSNFKKFPGGFLKLTGSNSVSNVKSTPARRVIVEEPDDTNKNVGDQGDAIRLARERLKRQSNVKLYVGGTPSVSELSEVEHYSKLGTQRVLPIECHDCGQSHVLDWQYVEYLESEDAPVHPIYGQFLPETALYVCPHCGSAWNDWRRQRNIYDTVAAAVEAGDPFCGWVKTVETTDALAEKIETFVKLSELYVCMPGTSLADVVADYLEAEHEAKLGDESARIVFQNSKLALPYEYMSSEKIDVESLQALADDRPELTVPAGGLRITAGVDVQHDRLAVIIRAYGHNMESWLVYWGELAGSPIDRNDPVWDELDNLIFRGFEHEKYGKVYLSAVTIDGSDGTTSDSVYYWGRTRGKKHRRVLVMVGKGDSNDNGKREVFRTPMTKIGHTDAKRRRKADKFEISIYMVGTHKAKDLIIKRLLGTSAFMHSYAEARADYWEQVTSEVKAPSKRLRGTKVYQVKAGRRNEALDCEVYSLHAAMALKLHTFTTKKWNGVAKTLGQTDLFKQSDNGDAETSPASAPAKKKKRKRRNPRRRKSLLN